MVCSVIDPLSWSPVSSRIKTKAAEQTNPPTPEELPIKGAVSLRKELIWHPTHLLIFLHQGLDL